MSINRIQCYRSYVPHTQEPSYRQISLDQFNEYFNCDMVILPHSLYAIGMKHNQVYIYNEKYASYYEMAFTARFVVNAIQYHKISFTDFYFVISSNDGFPEFHPFIERNKPRSIPRDKYVNKYNIDFDPTDNILDGYDIIHKNRLILCQNNNVADSTYTIPMPDHHYFALNYYYESRWQHNGLAFDQKIPKMVFASSIERSSKYNFRVKRDDDITQRELFYRDYENHPLVHAVKSGWQQPNFFNQNSQIQYKYILDMDGNASTWDSLAWKLRSGSIIFRVSGVWNQWFFSKFIPWVHFVPICEDFTDLIEKFEWCESNPDKCKEIILNACKLFEIYRFQNAEDYLLNDVLPRIML